MFKPVRVVAAIIFLAMIVMIFISAFALNNGTLCISKPSPPSSSSRFPYARTRSSLRHPRVLRIPMVHAVVYSVRALRSSQGVRQVIILLAPCNHPYLALVLATVRLCLFMAECDLNAFETPPVFQFTSDFSLLVQSFCQRKIDLFISVILKMGYLGFPVPFGILLMQSQSLSRHTHGHRVLTFDYLK